ncbi:hypothetical protein LOTGIDRAFT_165600 [Lottia gigantea]|uniref:Proton-coupled zinc antiporter SLC30A9, mitochondrial n=1 Tax=Lottia gigantea TaxID=225164 RepID=V3ZBR9_LOTGI|nr:hypothetical protein LOTGIDRAFT_165600 [Lottia gigantea]ESO88473.1 hypothetical protein LOTGIDRAFT_165600 [Lottia gigantea]
MMFPLSQRRVQCLFINKILYSSHQSISTNTVLRTLSISCKGCQATRLFQPRYRNKSKQLFLFPIHHVRVISSDSQNSQNVKSTDVQDKGKVKSKDVLKNDYYYFKDNIYIEPFNAMQKYLLTQKEIESLPCFKSRSPYHLGENFELFLRSDVEYIAIKKWGSLKAIEKEKMKRLEPYPFHCEFWKHVVNYIIHDDFERNVFMDDLVLLIVFKLGRKQEGTVDPKMYKFNPRKAPKLEKDNKIGPMNVVLSALGVNALLSVLKFWAASYTGSASMYAEFLHSLADTVNQLVLAYVTYLSSREADLNYPYGYMKRRNIFALLCGVSSFGLGSILSIWHGVEMITSLDSMNLQNTSVGMGVIGISLALELYSFSRAYKRIETESKAMGLSFKRYLFSGIDPFVTLVFSEDLIAVIGVSFAGVCMALSSSYESLLIMDPIGSIVIGCLLAGVAITNSKINVDSIAEKSIPQNEIEVLKDLLENDRMIKSVHDVKAIESGGLIRFKAEVNFDFKEITRDYLRRAHNKDEMLKKMVTAKTVEDVEKFMLSYGPLLAEQIGLQTDRIETKLKAKNSRVRHIDLEAI